MLSRTSKLLLVVTLVAGSLAIAAPAANTAPTFTARAQSGDRWAPGRVHAHLTNGKALIKWKNPTSRVHDVKSLNTMTNWTMRKKVVRPGKAVTKTFRKRGRFIYRCTIHSAKVGGKWTGMVAEIHVR